ncbi:MAG: metal-dependent hydrolase [Calditrichaceae bacterium]|nr:metal-dependent hydrolase [Calditrichaceae bacterium]
MDTITQAILGAGVGEVTLGKKVGNKAPMWGAVAGIVPDLDVIPGRLMSAVDYLVFHRGFSHSLIFSLIAAPIAGWLIAKIHKKENLDWKSWGLLFFLGLTTHILLDCFTTWGTQVFWPFDYRVAWNTIFVIDPLYTIPFAFVLIWTMFTRKENPMRVKLGWIGIGISTFYLLITVVNKQIAERAFISSFSHKQIEYTRINTRPTPFNSILWTGTIETEDGFYEGVYSLFDSDKNIRFEYFSKNHELIHHLKTDTDLQKLIFISKGLYTITPDGEDFLFQDFRYGRATSWLPDQKDNYFTFEYRIKESETYSESSRVIITREGRMRQLSNEIFYQLWQRILSNIR